MIRRVLALVVSFMVAVGLFAPSRVSAQFSRPPLKIVQLGDSYSAGNGARNESGDRSYYSVEGCYRSPDNWGNKYAQSLQERFTVTYVNRACSGGVISDITGKVRDVEVGGRRFKNAIFGQLVPCPAPEYPAEEFWVRTDGIPIDRCQRRLRPQIEAVDASVDLVLMTGGGNDAEFAEVVKQCFAVGYRDASDCKDKVDFANRQLDPENPDNIEEKLVAAFGELRNKLKPGAKVVYLSYPYLVPDVGYALRKTSLFGEDTIYPAGSKIRELGLLGDAKQRSAVERANAAAGEDFVVFVDDIKDLFEGPPSHLPNPFQSGSRNPDRWIYEFETRIPAEWYHYKPTGHEEISKLLIGKGTFMQDGSFPEVSADVDVAFVVDTTGSMGDEIAQVRADLSELVDQLEATTNSFRVAVISYRDFPERTGNGIDYAARLDQAFTSERNLIQAGIDSLTANGGGDFPETVFSGVSTAIDLPWRPGVAKVAIVIGDAPPLAPEPISNLTADALISRSLAVDPVQVISLDVASLDSGGVMTRIAEGTGGVVIDSAGDLPSEISDILDLTVTKPFAWIGESYTAKVGRSLTFDSNGSYDPSGGSITLYEWDFNGDGEFDISGTESTAEHVYEEPFEGFVVLRVTGPGGTALASARIVANETGSVPQGDTEACETDELGRSIVVDENGRFALCTALDLPTADLDGVTEIVESTTDVLIDQVAELAESLEPVAFRNKARELRKSFDAEDRAETCEVLEGLDALAKAQAGKKITPEESALMQELVDKIAVQLECPTSS